MSGMHQTNYPPSLTPKGSEADLTVSNSAVQLAAASVDDKAQMVMLQVQDADVRYTLDGSTPTASAGFIARVDDTLYLGVASAKAAKFIRDGSSDANIRSLSLV